MQPLPVGSPSGCSYAADVQWIGVTSSDGTNQTVPVCMPPAGSSGDGTTTTPGGASVAPSGDTTDPGAVGGSDPDASVLP